MPTLAAEILSELRDFIAQDEVLLALDTLEEVLPPEADRTLTPSLRARFNQLKKDKIKRVLSDSEFNIEMAKIRADFLEILSLFEDKKENVIESLHSFLVESIDNQNISIGKQHLVNCNRDEHNSLFWTEFPDKYEKKTPYQFYFIPACPTQSPYSLTERIIYEVEYFFEKMESKAVFYEHQNDVRRSLHNKIIDRVSLIDLPLGQNITLPLCLREFQDYFNHRFEKEGLMLKKTTDSYELSCHQKLHYDYVLLHFRLLDSDWKPFTAKYLEEIIKIFKTKNEGLPHFVFFFALTAKDFHVAPKAEITAAIEDLNQRYDEVCTVFSTLKPIQKQDLENWLRKNITDNQKNIDKILQLFEKEGINLNALANWKNNALLNMTDAEWLQELIYILAKKI